jgi:pyridoxine 5-phosphate synthase
MVKLSTNVNKVATLRNSRGGRIPSVLDAVRVCIEAGVRGITVHPRADARHITAADVHDIASLLKAHPGIEFNIEGDPRPDLLHLVHEIRPTQCTLVPVRPGEITSEAGWPRDTPKSEMRRIVSDLQHRGVRVSLFVDANEDAVRWAGDMGVDRVELYTEPFARAFELGDVAAHASFAEYAAAAETAQAAGMKVNAGHDLDLDNLVMFRRLPHLAEVSIGHALISHALFVGLARSVRDYLDVLSGAGRP